MTVPRLTAVQAKILAALQEDGPHTTAHLAREVLGSASASGATRALWVLWRTGAVAMVAFRDWAITNVGRVALRRHARRRGVEVAT